MYFRRDAGLCTSASLHQAISRADRGIWFPRVFAIARGRARRSILHRGAPGFFDTGTIPLPPHGVRPPAGALRCPAVVARPDPSPGTLLPAGKRSVITRLLGSACADASAAPDVDPPQTDGRVLLVLDLHIGAWALDTRVERCYTRGGLATPVGRVPTIRGVAMSARIRTGHSTRLCWLGCFGDRCLLCHTLRSTGPIPCAGKPSAGFVRAAPVPRRRGYPVTTGLRNRLGS